MIINGSPIDTHSLHQGTDFMAVVTVANISGTTDYTNLALTHIIPAGWEIFNERMAGQITTSAPYSYQDIRDDRILTYFNLQQGQAKTFTVRLQATYSGDLSCRPSSVKRCMMPMYRQGHRQAELKLSDKASNKKTDESDS